MLHVAAQHLPLSQTLLGISPVGTDVVVQGLLAASAVLLSTEAAKWWINRTRRARSSGTLLMERGCDGADDAGRSNILRRE